MTSLRALRRREDGMTMVLVVVSIVVLSVLSSTLYLILNSESTRSNNAVRSNASFQAAEAGIHAYMAKLLDDSSFFLHYITKGESSRRTSSGTVVAGDPSTNVTWTGGTTWTYPNGFDKWRALGNGYEYSLQITPPSSSQPGIGIIAAGRKIGATTGTRKIEAIVRQAGVTDFQMLANDDISYGSGATTRGKIYAGEDSSGSKHSVDHDGHAYADIYAEGDITGSVTMHDGAGKYDGDSNPNVRVMIETPIVFSNFLTTLSQIQSAAQAGGVYLNDSSKDAWFLKFSSNGTFTAQACTESSGDDIEDTQPSCGTATTYNVPANGAVYVVQSAIVANASSGGGVKGRVTVASNNNLVVGGDIGPVTVGTDVLGLVGRYNVYVAQWVPYNLTWSAATISQEGRWQSAPGAGGGSHGTMTFTGSIATDDGGSMGMFQTRVYQYEPTFLYLQPPWFPNISDSLTTVLFRELPPS
jgi:Tfp pilus assembly protein PilX